MKFLREFYFLFDKFGVIYKHRTFEKGVYCLLSFSDEPFVIRHVTEESACHKDNLQSDFMDAKPYHFEVPTISNIWVVILFENILSSFVITRLFFKHSDLQQNIP